MGRTIPPKGLMIMAGRHTKHIDKILDVVDLNGCVRLIIALKECHTSRSYQIVSQIVTSLSLPHL